MWFPPFGTHKQMVIISCIIVWSLLQSIADFANALNKICTDKQPSPLLM